ncbi:hypothetical protein [Planococcus chinensis]|uniref:hypothetical protein n=1 Tax=Planococcus chinensis TaxID=272917 RepID=UPI001CC615DE|nr:hypothetical protein [Planococcus chinensis]
MNKFSIRGDGGWRKRGGEKTKKIAGGFGMWLNSFSSCWILFCTFQGSSFGLCGSFKNFIELKSIQKRLAVFECLFIFINSASKPAKRKTLLIPQSAYRKEQQLHARSSPAF